MIKGIKVCVSTTLLRVWCLVLVLVCIYDKKKDESICTIKIVATPYSNIPLSPACVYKPLRLAVFCCYRLCKAVAVPE